MPSLARKHSDLSHLFLRYIGWINAARADPGVMDREHDPRRGLVVFFEKELQYFTTNSMGV